MGVHTSAGFENPKGGQCGPEGCRARFDGCLYKIGARLLGGWEELGELVELAGKGVQCLDVSE